MPLAALLPHLSSKWKAIGLLFGIFTAGLSAGAVAGGFTKLPARVASLEAQHDSIHRQMEVLGDDVAAIRKTNRQMLCLTIAEREHGDWRKCIE